MDDGAAVGLEVIVDHHALNAVACRDRLFVDVGPGAAIEWKLESLNVRLLLPRTVRGATDELVDVREVPSLRRSSPSHLPPLGLFRLLEPDFTRPSSVY